MTIQVWGLLGSSKIIFDRTDGNIWKVTVPFLESGEYIVALYALDDAGNQAYVATILLDYASKVYRKEYCVVAGIQDNRYSIHAQMQDYWIKQEWLDYSVEQERLEGRVAYFAEDAANV